nr:RDD family protein [Gemmatimonadaceae bacterium]
MPAAGSRTTLDHTIDIETPEMVVVSYAVAGVASRVLAGLIDLVICLVALVVFAVAMVTMAPAVAGAVVSRTSASWALSILILAQFAILWGYYVLLEGLRDGQTLGKRWLGLRVVKDGGYSVSLGASAVRNLLRLVDYQPG